MLLKKHSDLPNWLVCEFHWIERIRLFQKCIRKQVLIQFLKRHLTCLLTSFWLLLLWSNDKFKKNLSVWGHKYFRQNEMPRLGLPYTFWSDYPSLRHHCKETENYTTDWTKPWEWNRVNLTDGICRFLC